MTEETQTGPVLRWGQPRCERLLLILLMSAAAIGYCFPPVNIDEGAILDFARRMLGGAVLYRDLVDVNPPMIFLLNLLPASILDWTGLPPAPVVTACVLALPCLALRPLHGFLSLMSGNAVARSALLLAAVYLLMLYPGAEFSQREHLLLLALLPYLYNLHSFIDGKGNGRPISGRLVEVLPMAVMVCQKPYFALIPALLEACALLSVGWKQRLRLELVLQLVLGAVFLVATILVFPDYLEHVLPLAAHLYGIADPGLLAEGFLGGEGRQLLLAIALLGAVHAFFMRRLWLKLLLLCIVACYLEAALQLKDWSYHFLPARALTILSVAGCAATALVEWLERGWPVRSRALIAMALLPILLLLSLPEMLEAGPLSVFPLPYPAQRGFARDGWARIRQIVAQRAHDGRVMWLSRYNEAPAFAVSYAGAELISPTMSLWMLPALYQAHQLRDGHVVFHDPAHMSSEETWLWRAVSDRFFALSPTLVVDVADDAGMRPGRFDYIDYFSTNPKFRMRFASYRKIYEDSLARVYVRLPSALAAGPASVTASTR